MILPLNNPFLIMKIKKTDYFEAIFGVGTHRYAMASSVSMCTIDIFLKKTDWLLLIKKMN